MDIQKERETKMALFGKKYQQKHRELSQAKLDNSTKLIDANTARKIQANRKQRRTVLIASSISSSSSSAAPSSVLPPPVENFVKRKDLFADAHRQAAKTKVNARHVVLPPHMKKSKTLPFPSSQPTSSSQSQSQHRNSGAKRSASLTNLDKFATSNKKIKTNPVRLSSGSKGNIQTQDNDRSQLWGNLVVEEI